MLGSDPVAALLGSGVSTRAGTGVWSAYLRALVAAGLGITLLGPDVTVPGDADPMLLRSLAALVAAYPPGAQMPAAETGNLVGHGLVDTVAQRLRSRTAAYFTRIGKIVGKDRLPQLVADGTITPGAALHVGASGLVAVSVPDGAALARWRDWAARTSGDRYERHSAPTLLLPTAPGGGVYLFRVPAAAAVPSDLTADVSGSTVTTGDMVVPLPPTRLGGAPVSRLGPCRMLPDWFHRVIHYYSCAAGVLKPAMLIA